VVLFKSSKVAERIMKNTDVHVDILGFNPYSDKIQVFVHIVTPDMARHILNHLNKDNRKMIRSQVNKIAKSIRVDGWMEDGQPLTFNKEGNITEAQHRLEAIIMEDVEVPMVIVLGVDTGCFTKCAPAKPRRAEDEIQRKDKSATPSEVSTLRQLLVRRQGEKLSMQNAIEQWNHWRLTVREGRKLVDNFFTEVDDYNPWERTFAAWASLMVSIGQEDVAETFLSFLQAEVLEDESPSRLTNDFRKFFEQHSTYMSAAGRTEFIYKLLCVAGDRLMKKPNGDIGLDLTLDKLDHDKLNKRGCYRKFLENPDNLPEVIPADY